MAARLVCSAGLLAAVPSTLAGQVTGSVGLGASSMQQPGSAPQTSASLFPAVSMASGPFVGNFSGALTALPFGEWAEQGYGDAWLVSGRFAGHLRAAMEVSGSHQVRVGASGSALHAIGDLAWDGGAWGFAVGAGMSAGFIPGLPDVSAFHARLRTWRRDGIARYSARIEPVSWLGSWYYDLAGGVDLARGPLAVSLALSGRTGPAAQGSVGGGASADVIVLPGLAVEAAAGSTLRDPFQGLPNVSYVSLGLRVFGALHRGVQPGRGATPRSRAATGRARSEASALVLDRSGDSGAVTVRFRMGGARSVAIAGDWDDWRPYQLHAAAGAPDVFTGQLAVPPGRWQFTLLVDGTDWVVPEGIATVPDSSDSESGVVSVLVVR